MRPIKLPSGSRTNPRPQFVVGHLGRQIFHAHFPFENSSPGRSSVETLPKPIDQKVPESDASNGRFFNFGKKRRRFAPAFPETRKPGNYLRQTFQLPENLPQKISSVSSFQNFWRKCAPTFPETGMTSRLYDHQQVREKPPKRPKK